MTELPPPAGSDPAEAGEPAFDDPRYGYVLPPGPAPRPRKSDRPRLSIALAFAAGAALVGILWTALSLSGSGASGLPVTAPESLGGLSRFQLALSRIGTDLAKGQIDTANSDDARNVEIISAAYGGAPAAYARYYGADLSPGVQLVAVRAPTPDPIVPYENLAQLGLAVPGHELRRVGEVRCVVANQPTRRGDLPRPDATIVGSCQRSGPALTVQIKVTGDAGLEHSPQRVAALVEQAWQAMS